MNGNQIGGTIVWNLDVDDSKFKAGLNKAKSDASSAAKQIDSEFVSLGDRINKSFQNAAEGSKMFATGLLAVGSATAVAAGFGIKYAADLETMKQGFVTLLGSTEKANAAISQIEKDAATTPFEFKGLVQANQLLTSVTKDAGKSESLLLDVGKALTAMGKGQPELDRIIVNLQQIGAVGHASAIDIKQFAFAGIPIYDLLRDHIKGTGQSLDDFISDGKVSFELLTKLFQEAGNGSGRFAKAFETQGGTFNQVLSNMKDNLGITASQLVIQTGLFDAVKNALKGFTDQLSYLASPAGIQQVIKIFDAIKANAPIIIGLVAGGLAPAFYAWAGATLAALAPLIPFIVAGAALGALIKVLNDRFDLLGKGLPILIGLLTTAGVIIGSIIVPMFIAWAAAAIPAAIATIAAAAPLLLLATAIGVVVAGLAYLILNWGTIWPKVVAIASSAITTVTNFFKNLWQSVSVFVSDLVTNVVTGFTTFFQQVSTIVSSAITATIAWFEQLPARLGQALVNTGLAFVNFLGFVTGLIIYGVPKLIEMYINFWLELPGKLASALVLTYDTIVSWFTQAWAWLSTTVPMIIDSVVSFFVALPGRVMAALQSLLNTIVGGFVAIWNWLSAVVPQIIESVVSFFASLPAKIGAWLVTTKDGVSKGFTDIWNAIVAEVSSWPGKLYDWGANIANSFVNGIKSAIGHIVDAFKDGLNKAKSLVEGHSPPIAGPFQNIDQWGFNVGTAWVDGVRKAIAGMTIDNPFTTSIPAVAPAQASAAVGGGKSGPLVNIEQMNVRDQSDITDIARELGFRIELSPGYTQNG